MYFIAKNSLVAEVTFKKFKNSASRSIDPFYLFIVWSDKINPGHGKVKEMSGKMKI